MTATRVCAALAVLASVALPLLVRADPPQPAATGFLLPAGTVVILTIEDRVDSATTAPGAIVRSRLRQPLVVAGMTLAPAGAPVTLTVTGTRPASPGVEGQIVFSTGPIRLGSGHELPLRLAHIAVSPLLVSANPDDITIPGQNAVTLGRGGDIVLTPGTVMRAATTAALDATDPQKIVIVTPPPYALSTDRPYSAFTPIPLATYDPLGAPQRGGRGRGRGGRPATPTASPSATQQPSATPSPAPTSS